MARSTRDNTKRRPDRTGLLVGVRLQPAMLAELDAWIAARDKPISRPEAIRVFIAAGLHGVGRGGTRALIEGMDRVIHDLKREGDADK